MPRTRPDPRARDAADRRCPFTRSLITNPDGPESQPPETRGHALFSYGFTPHRKTGGGGAGNFPSKSESGSGFGPRPRLLGFSSVPC